MQIYSINKNPRKDLKLDFPIDFGKGFLFFFFKCELVNHFAYLTDRSKAQHRREDDIQNHEKKKLRKKPHKDDRKLRV